MSCVILGINIFVLFLEQQSTIIINGYLIQGNT